MKNHYILEYNDIFINNEIQIDDTDRDCWQTCKVNSVNSLSENGLKFLQQSGFTPFSNFNLYIGPPMADTPIHIDNLFTSYALNYIWSESKSKMRWFKLKDDEVFTPALSTANTNFMVYKDHQVDLIEEIDVPNNTLILVRINVPHQVSNYSNSKRYCLSVRGFPVINWERAVEHFSPHFQK